jgi:hypothetical protein
MKYKQTKFEPALKIDAIIPTAKLYLAFGYLFVAVIFATALVH